MFSYIKGQITRTLSDRITLEQSGIGYEIFCDANTLRQLPRDEEAKVWIYLHLRENVMQLYGFADLEQRSLFELLLTVSGIGPKVALSVTGTLSPDRFALAVLNNDLKCLTSIKHVGKKSAERMVLELKDKLKGADLSTSRPAVGGTVFVEEKTGGVIEESLAALLVLGYGRAEAESAVNRAVADLTETGETLQLELIIKNSLRNLAR